MTKFEWGAKDWIKKLAEQAASSREYRHKLYSKVGLAEAGSVLDVGCGTGAVTLDLARSTKGKVTGIDIDPEKLEEARKILPLAPNLELLEADAQALPFEDGSFDLVVFTIVLVYIPDQQKALNEMARVTRKGGHVLACMEPDYAGRIEYPESEITGLWVEAMKELNADVTTGRKLKVLFTRAGLRTECGIETETDYILIKDDRKRAEKFKQQMWIYDKMLKAQGWSEDRIEQYKNEQLELARKGLSFNFTPVMYAIGEKV